MKKIQWFLWLLPYCVFGQVTFDSEVVPMDMAVIARDINNKGQVIIKGEIKKTAENYNYDQLRITVYKGSSFFTAPVPVDQQVIDVINYNLNWQGNTSSFSVPYTIEAELKNYSFKIEGYTIATNTYVGIRIIKNIVAGDVYIIQGQSNAVSKTYGTLADPLNKSPFIRTFGSPNGDDREITEPSRNIWKEAIGDLDTYIVGFIGQWGLKLGKLIIDQQQVPVAFFNGASGNKSISYFQKNASPDGPNTNNYERLYHRLDTTNLRNKVKAIFWSQGESDDVLTAANYQTYITSFNQLKTDWMTDYPGVNKFYIFQTKSGCSNTPGTNEAIYVKEAQRQLATQDNVHLMQTAGLTYSSGFFNCHFTYTNGYEGFAKRIYKLVNRDFYGGNLIADIEAPKPLATYMIDDRTLVIQTDAISLTMQNPPLSDFVLGNTTATIETVGVSGSQIIFKLSEFPGVNTRLTYKGLGAGENQNNFVVNSQGLELVSFADLAIDTSLFTIWNGSSWIYNTPPDITKYVIFNGTYNHSGGDFSAKTLTVRQGNTVNFSDNTISAVTVQDKLDVQGSLNLGDHKSLIVNNENPDAIVMGLGGIFKKIEKSEAKANQYAVTYWASPTDSPDLQSTFPGVAGNRIFELDPTYSNPLYTGQYEKYKHWKIANGSMVKGKGYSVDGPTSATYPNYVETIEFSGKPNNGTITIPLKMDISDGPHTGYDANLIGNPYPSAIDADLFINQNTGKFTGAIYFWSQKTDPIANDGEYEEADYKTYTLAGPSSSGVTNIIGSGQGFMIIASQNGDVEFNNAMRLKDINNQFFKSELNKSKPEKDQKDRIWLRLKNEENLVKDILIGFFKEATDGEDFGYDALSLSDTHLKFYSLLDNKKYVIQSLGEFDDKKTISLGLETDMPGKCSIAINQSEGALKDKKIYLQDKVTGKMHDLTKGSYDFEVLSAGDLSNRFTLYFKGKSSNEVSPQKNHWVLITNTNNGFTIHSEEEIIGIKVYDLYGRLVFRSYPFKSTYHIDLLKIKKGSVLIIQVNLKNGQTTNKKVIRF